MSIRPTDHPARREFPLAVVAAVTGLVVSGCSGQDSAHVDVPTSTISMPSLTTGVGFSEWLTHRRFSVRVLEYRRGELRTSDPGQRHDRIVVEECAPGPRSTVAPHDDWVLVGATGRVLGRAADAGTQRGVTDEPPAALAAGPCRRSPLVVPVPSDSEPVAVRDGTDATWVIPTS